MARLNNLLFLYLAIFLIILGSISVFGEKSEAKAKPKPKAKKSQKTDMPPGPPGGPPIPKSPQKNGEKTKSKDWNERIRNLDREWEEGDEEEELEKEDVRMKRLNTLKKQHNFQQVKNADDMAKAYQADPTVGGFSGSSSGSMMVFVELTDKQSNGKDWDKAAKDELSKKYSRLMMTGSLSAHVFSIENNRLLMSMDRTWQIKELFNFLSLQSEVVAFEVDGTNKKHKAADWRDRDEDDDDDL